MTKKRNQALRRLMELDYVIDIFEEEGMRIPKCVFNRIDELQSIFVKGKEK